MQGAWVRSLVRELDPTCMPQLRSTPAATKTQSNLKYINKINILKNINMDFPGGSVVKNLPANAGDTGSIPGPGRSHMPRSNKASEPQLLKPVL